MSKPAIISFDANAKMEQWPDFPESEIASGSRAQRGHAWFDDKACGLSAGIWEAEANISHWMDYPVTEFMLVLEGEVVRHAEGQLQRPREPQFRKVRPRAPKFRPLDFRGDPSATLETEARRRKSVV